MPFTSNLFEHSRRKLGPKTSRRVPSHLRVGHGHFNSHIPRAIRIIRLPVCALICPVGCVCTHDVAAILPIVLQNAGAPSAPALGREQERLAVDVGERGRQPRSIRGIPLDYGLLKVARGVSRGAGISGTLSSLSLSLFLFLSFSLSLSLSLSHTHDDTNTARLGQNSWHRCNAAARYASHLRRAHVSFVFKIPSSSNTASSPQTTDMIFFMTVNRRAGEGRTIAVDIKAAYLFSVNRRTSQPDSKVTSSITNWQRT